MTSTTRKKLRAAVAALVFASVMSGTAGAEASHGPSVYRGHFSTTDDGTKLGYHIGGTATMKIQSTSTRVRVKIDGLKPSGVYASHLHNGTCGDGGGGHYQDKDDGSGLEKPPNELWLSSRGKEALKANRHGLARGRGEADWAARTVSTTQTNALSIVVHAPEKGPRIACADLS